MRRGRIAVVVVLALMSTDCVRRLHDACKTDRECPQAASCRQWYAQIAYPEGNGICEIPCESSDDCPADMSCSSGFDVLGSICVEDKLGLGRPDKVAGLHEACADDVTCVSGWCQTWHTAGGEKVQRCEFLCRADDPPSTSCPDGYRCEHPAEGPSRCFAAPP